VTASIEGLARLGYAAKGVVYVLIGWLAVQAALGTGGRTTGSRGALLEILAGPFGRVALGVAAVGLAGYALWRFVQCFKDPRPRGLRPARSRRAGRAARERDRLCGFDGRGSRDADRR
jgi:hypothetical protein